MEKYSHRLSHREAKKVTLRELIKRMNGEEEPTAEGQSRVATRQALALANYRMVVLCVKQ